MRRSTWLLVSIALLAGVASPSLVRARAAGQSAMVRGIVRDSTTELPVRAAFVQLLDAAGRRSAGALTDSLGACALRAAAGR